MEAKQLTDLSIKELSSLLSKRQISSVELTKAYLDRCEKLNPKVNAFITLCYDNALEDAKRADETLNTGEGQPLTGIPMSIKDNICTKGVTTTCGSKMLEDFVPPYNATAVLKLQRAGYVLLGKNNMDEFAMGGASQTSYFGGVKNPYGLKRVPGGSSGGSAVSVSALMSAGSLGSDTGGSVRQPASFCGVTGLKPTYGTVSRYGLVAFASSFDQIGPIGKTAEDCGIILNAIAGGDRNDATCNLIHIPDYTEKIDTDLKGTVIGLPKEFFEIELEESVKSALLKAVEYYKSLGFVIKEVSIPSLKYAVSTYYLISSAEAASNLSRFDGIKYGYRSKKGKTYEELIANTRREGFGWEVKRRIMLGNYALSSGYYDAYYNKAAALRGKIKAEYEEVLKECDCLLTPTAPTTAYKIGQQEKDPVKMYSADICTVTANISGLPAISTTCGYDDNGLPIGMSITGRAFYEADIIAIAHRFEKDFCKKGAAL